MGWVSWITRGSCRAVGQLEAEVYRGAINRLGHVATNTSQEWYYLLVGVLGQHTLLPVEAPRELWAALREYEHRVREVIYVVQVAMSSEHRFVALFVVERKALKVLFYDERAGQQREWELKPDEIERFTQDLIDSKFSPPNPHLDRIRKFMFSPELN